MLLDLDAASMAAWHKALYCYNPPSTSSRQYSCGLRSYTC